MKLISLSVLVILALTPVIQAQSGTASDTKPMTPAERSAAIMQKVSQVDLLVQVLPLAIRKEQYGPLLTVIEKNRQKEKVIRSNENEDLLRIEQDLNKAVSDGLEKGAYPPKEMRFKAIKLLNAMSIRRRIAVKEMVEDVYKVVSTTFDAGQLKVMENSLDPASDDPTVKRESLDAKAKINFFIERVFLDTLVYDILLKLEKAAG
jgi:hypothetical protein